jgi:hypothetical protein
MTQPATTRQNALDLWRNQIKFYYVDMPKGFCTLRQAQCWAAQDLREKGLIPQNCLLEFGNFGDLPEEEK